MAFLKKTKTKKLIKNNKDLKKSQKKKIKPFAKLNPSQAPRILFKPIVSEKASRQQSKFNQYVFEIAPEAEKIEIKRAVESFYKVKVKKVNIIKMKGKIKRFGTKLGKRKDWKKAVLKLKQGKSITL